MSKKKTFSLLEVGVGGQTSYETVRSSNTFFSIDMIPNLLVLHFFRMLPHILQSRDDSDRCQDQIHRKKYVFKKWWRF